MDTKALRQKILDLAIRGKLVPQDPNDEPASVLLEKIRVQKQQMVKDGKLKAKDIKNDTIIFRGEDNLHYEKFADGTVKCIEDEIPFEVPEGWGWCRLSSICLKVTDGTHHSPDNFPHGEYMYITAKNIKTTGIILNDLTYVTAEVHKEIFARCNPEFGDILYIKDGATSGIATINNLHEEFSMLSSVALFKPSTYVDNWYICYAMQSPYFYSTTRDDMKGVGITRITLNMLNTRLIPVPPQTEQKQISNIIQKLIDIVLSIETNQDRITQVLHLTKSKILDLAIRGKLVPQDPNDEPASVLLEHIRAEKEELIKAGKIKRDKNESVIFKGDDNSYYEQSSKFTHCINDIIPFEIPENWHWVRLGNIFQHNTGKALNASDEIGTKFPYITTSNVYWNRFELNNLKEMSFKDTEIDKCTICKGDLLVCEGGDIGRSAIWCFDYSMKIQNHIHRLRPYHKISIKFYYYVLYLYKHSGFIDGNGIGIQSLSSNALHKMLLPVPSYEEQKRITMKVDIIFEKLDLLTESLL